MRFRSATLLLVAPVVAAMMILPGCGSDEKKPTTPASVPTPSATGGKKKKGEKLEELDAKTTGTFKGKVILDGDIPKMAVIADMAKHADSKACLAGADSEKNEQTWIVGAGKGVANVVIKLLPPDGKKFKNVDLDKNEVEIDQPHCAFIPNVVALKPGQKLKVLNSADVPHNTKTAVDPRVNQEENKTIPPGSSIFYKFEYQKDPVVLSCNFHSWMSAKVYVNDSPYITVTKDDGSFEIPNVPTGVELVVVGIHGSGKIADEKMIFKDGDNVKDLKISVK